MRDREEEQEEPEEEEDDDDENRVRAWVLGWVIDAIYSIRRQSIAGSGNEID
jgi:hypothetical protein